MQDYRYSWTPSTTNPNSGVFEATGGPSPMYNGSVATPSWYAFDVPDEQMTETMLAQHAVDTLRNLSTHALPAPFFVAVGFHKPRKTRRPAHPGVPSDGSGVPSDPSPLCRGADVPWYAPKKYWDYSPNSSVTLAPHPYKPIGAPNIAMQDVMRGWSTPHGGRTPPGNR